MIIIPDVHGRTFWKDAVKMKEGPTEKVVFLGDYLDPYPWEGISRDSTLENFKEILEYIKSNRETTVALLGNHDFMTYLSKEMGDCRTDFGNAPEIGRLFRDNLELFKVAWLTDGGGDVKYLFSHSALLPEWVKENCRDGITRKAFFNQSDTIEDIVEALNWSLHNSFDALVSILNQVSWCRGGDWDIGSIVWADIHEVPRMSPLWPGVHSVFGHSQRESRPVLMPYWSCLDVRRAFRLTDDGDIQELMTGDGEEEH